MVVSLLGALVAASTFGVLALLFAGPHPPLGGPGYLDPITAISVISIAFGITGLFSIVRLRSTRTALLGGSTTREAVRKGLRETAAATAGAGVLTAGALIPFLLTGLLNAQALGIGPAAAVPLNMLIVGPALLPAAETLLGRSGWWPTLGTRLGSPSHPHSRRVVFPPRELPGRRPRPAHP